MKVAVDLDLADAVARRDLDAEDFSALLVGLALHQVTAPELAPALHQPLEARSSRRQLLTSRTRR